MIPTAYANEMDHLVTADDVLKIFKIVNYAKMTKLSQYWKWTAFNSLLGEDFLRCGFWTLSFWDKMLFETAVSRFALPELFLVVNTYLYCEIFVVRFWCDGAVGSLWHTNYVFLEAWIQNSNSKIFKDNSRYFTKLSQPMRMNLIMNPR